MSGMQIILFVTLTAQTAVQAARVALPLYLLDLDAGPATIGLLAATFSVFPAVMAVPMGRLVDRRGARLPMVVAMFVGLAGMLIPFFLRGVAAVFAGGIAIGIVMGCLNLALQNLVGVLSKPDERPRNFANFALGNSTASFIGPVLAGLSIDHLGHAAACAVVAALFLPSLGLMMSGTHAAINKIVPRAEHDRKKGRTLELLSVPGMKRTLVAISVQSVGDILYSYYLPVYCHSIGLSASIIGLVLGCNAAAAFVVRAALPHLIKRLGELRVLSLAFYLSAASIVLMPATTSAIVLGLLSFGLGAGMGVTGPIVNLLLFAHSPPGRSGEALGIRTIFNHGTKTASPMMLSFIIAATSLAPAFWFTAALFGLGAWLTAPRAGDRQSAAAHRASEP